GPQRARIAHVDVHTAQRLPDGLLAALVDDAAGGAAAEGDRRRPLQNFHRFQIERVAAIETEIAYAVHIHVVARSEAANGGAVAHPFEFPRTERDAWHVAQRVIEGHHIAVIEHLLA